MRAEMDVQSALPGVRLSADLALVGLLPRVNEHMRLQVALGHETSAATIEIAVERPRPHVITDVRLQIADAFEVADAGQERAEELLV